MRRDDLDLLATRSGTTLINCRWEERLVDVNQLGERSVSPPTVRVFIDGEQGHGWNEAAVHRQLEVLRDFLEAQPHRDCVAAFDAARARGPLQ